PSCAHLVPPSFPPRRSSDLEDLSRRGVHRRGVGAVQQVQRLLRLGEFLLDLLALDQGDDPAGGARGLSRDGFPGRIGPGGGARRDRKSTRLNSSHVKISYAV